MMGSALFAFAVPLAFLFGTGTIFPNHETTLRHYALNFFLNKLVNTKLRRSPFYFAGRENIGEVKTWLFVVQRFTV